MYLMRLGAKFRSQVRGAHHFSIWAVGRGSKQSSQSMPVFIILFSTVAPLPSRAASLVRSRLTFCHSFLAPTPLISTLIPTSLALSSSSFEHLSIMTPLSSYAGTPSQQERSANASLRWNSRLQYLENKLSLSFAALQSRLIIIGRIKTRTHPPHTLAPNGS